MRTRHSSLPASLAFSFACFELLVCPWAVSQQRPSANPHPQIQVVESTEDALEILKQRSPLRFGSTQGSGLTIRVDDTVKFQQLDGFGASLTESSGWLFTHKLTGGQRADVLKMLFSPSQGIGLSLLRQPMGASDFSLSLYSYDDVPAGEKDFDLKHFSIDHDRPEILRLLKAARALNPNLKIIASPWSAPAWMKTSGSMIGGSLLREAYASFANYFVRFVQAYEAEGVPIYAVTIQNEPMNIPQDYAGMGMTPAEQTIFLRDNLGPAFRRARLTTKIMIFDHNWDLLEFPAAVLSDAQAASFAAGTATHCYGGDPAAQSALHDHFPALDIWMTECSGGDWQKGRLLEQGARLVISNTRNWAKSVVLWNLALNQKHEPHLGGCKDCRGVITVDDSRQPAEVLRNPDFTALAHASKYVRPGAWRIDSNSFGEGSLEDVAFKNPDGSIVLLVLNSSAGPLNFNITWQGQFASCVLQPGAVATFSWTAKPENKP
jgi:glucosylceramidase